MPTSLIVMFLHLPVELIVKILMKLDTVDLVNMELTCVYVKTMQKIIFLRYTIQNTIKYYALP